MTDTVYRNYTDQELLQVLSDKRHHSPVIEELCQRLEEYSPVLQKETNIQKECPVCEAKIMIDIDVNGNGCYEIEIQTT